jgi:hypothetical protein
MPFGFQPMCAGLVIERLRQAEGGTYDQASHWLTSRGNHG